MTSKEAAQRVLEEAGEPLHYETITERALEAGYWSTEGKTPQDTVNAQMVVSINEKGDESPFQRVRPGVYALRKWDLSEYVTSSQGVGLDKERRVRVPFFPTYREARHLLRALIGVARNTLQSMRDEIKEQMGTPQNPVNWSDPDTWIDARLSGKSADLALRIWNESSSSLNPRYLRGPLSLLKNYGLITTTGDGVFTPTPRGEAFLDSDPDVVGHIDEQEGLGKILDILATKGRAKSADLLPEWADYLDTYSNYTSPTSMKGTLRERLANLVDRDLVRDEGRTYVLAQAGADYADAFAKEAGGSPKQELQHALKEYNDAQRETLREKLATMDPNDFEHLVRDLLEAMGYEDVEVTKQSGDKGVDVVATVQLGITEVKEVVQVKRYQHTVNRPKVDQLRGALHHHDAIRGTLITLSGFSQGSKDAAVLSGAAPISLIDGDRLLDLLVEHEVGIQKKPAVLYEVDGRYFDRESHE